MSGPPLCSLCGRPGWEGRSVHAGPCVDNQVIDVGNAWVAQHQADGWVRMRGNGGKICPLLPLDLRSRFFTYGGDVLRLCSYSSEWDVRAYQPTHATVALLAAGWAFQPDGEHCWWLETGWWVRPWVKTILVLKLDVTARLDLVDEYLGEGGLAAESCAAIAAARRLGAAPTDLLAMLPARCGRRAGRPACTLRKGHAGDHMNSALTWAGAEPPVVRTDKNSLIARTKHLRET